MITPKKPTETDSSHGENDLYMQIMKDYRLNNNEMSWMELAKCKGRNDITWFPEPGESHLVTIAKKFCSDCPVRKRCLSWALDNDIPYGVWGGKSASNRKKMLNNYIQEDTIGL